MYKGVVNFTITKFHVYLNERRSDNLSAKAYKNHIIYELVGMGVKHSLRDKVMCTKRSFSEGFSSKL